MIAVRSLAGWGGAGRRSTRVVERNLMVYRHTWVIIVSGFFEPLVYLLGIGYGVGSLVSHVTVGAGRALPYAVFVAPALMATAAMNGTIYETTFNFFGKLHDSLTYDAILATPLSIGNVVSGEVMFALMRGSVYAIGFVAVMTVLGLVLSPLAVLAVPGALLIAFSFACVGILATTFVRYWSDFDTVQLFLLPMFLFSGTFYPLSAYPAALQVVLELTPLYHGVHLLRELTTARLGLDAFGDVVYLVVLGVVALLLARRRLGRILRV